MNYEADYLELLGCLRRVHVLGSVADLLGWDEQVNLPEAAAEHRGKQLGLLAELQHAELSRPRLGELIESLDTGGAGDPGRRAVLRQARKDRERAVRLSSDFVREKALHCSRSFHVWLEARAASDFSRFAPCIEKHIELVRHEARELGWGDRAYDYMLDLHDPGMSQAVLTGLFDELRAGLVPFARSIVDSPVKPDSAFLRGFDVAAQRDFVRELTGAIGFDYKRGRLDVSVHPFCSGSGTDIRLTTRFDPDTPLDAVFSAIHEAGHGMYEQGLPAEFNGTALGLAAGMGVHESQSRLWENQVARSCGFWCHFEPRLRQRFPRQLEGVGSDALYLAINAVAPTLIRVDSDEVTYNLHILLRYGIERSLFSGELQVRDLPEAWRAASKELLGLSPGSDAEGVLQDVHWSGGAFGYFPSYCIGNMLAAQLWYRLRVDIPDLDHRLASGDFASLLDWLRTHVHAHARTLDVLALTRSATGEDLSPRSLLRYLKERYSPLYL